jgi:hypothetical protein
VDFPSADADTTGKIMRFSVGPAVAPDPTTPPQFLVLPAIAPLPVESVTRPLALIERMGMGYDSNGEMVDGPMEALLGTVEDGAAVRKMWMEPVTEKHLSPDGRRVAVSRGTPSDLRVLDLERGTQSRLAFEPQEERSPVWSRDGRWIYCSLWTPVNPQNARKAANGAGSVASRARANGGPGQASRSASRAPRGSARGAAERVPRP